MQNLILSQREQLKDVFKELRFKYGYVVGTGIRNYLKEQILELANSRDYIYYLWYDNGVFRNNNPGGTFVTLYWKGDAQVILDVLRNHHLNGVWDLNPNHPIQVYIQND